MTVICGGAASQPIPGYPRNVYVDAAAIEGAIILLGYANVAAALGPLIAGVAYDLATICSTDPPSDPGITVSDIGDALNFTNIVASAAAIAKLRQWFLSWYWYKVCECATIATPAPPTPSNPGSGFGLNPGLPTGLPAPPCWSNTTTATFLNPNNLGLFIDTQAFYWNDGHNSPSGQPNRFLPTPNPASLTFTATAFPSGANPVQSPTLQWAWGDINGLPITTFTTINPYPGHTFTTTLTPISAARSVILNFSYDSAHTPPGASTPTGYIVISGNMQCSGQSPQQNVSACCPPDPIVETMLQQILGLATLIQRQLAPFAYVLGTTHTALSGTGALSVQGLLGVKVHPTTLPGNVGVEHGDPDTLWLDSWINWGNADGFSAREFLRSSPFLSFPSAAGQYSQLGYSLAPGLVVDVTELVREP